jgi:hypothetical protein
MASPRGAARRGGGHRGLAPVGRCLGLPLRLAARDQAVYAGHLVPYSAGVIGPPGGTTAVSAAER